MTKAQEIGKRIAQARRELAVREQRDIRPADIARALDVSGPTVSEWESGKIKPRDELMERLADFLGVTPGFLRYGERPGERRSEQEGRRVPLASYQIPDAVAKALAEAQATAPAPPKETTRPARRGKAKGQR